MRVTDKMIMESVKELQKKGVVIKVRPCSNGGYTFHGPGFSSTTGMTGREAWFWLEGFFAAKDAIKENVPVKTDVPDAKGEYVLPLAEMSDWLLCVVACCPSFETIGMTKEQVSLLYRRVYSRSNGYGERGHVPTQGYDWSGVRDSTPDAVKEMGAAARQYLDSQGVVNVNFRKLM